MTLNLSPEAVSAYRTIIEDPEKHGFKFKPLKECFESCEDATPKHILFQEYLEYINCPLPKVIFYIIMDQLYPVGKAPNGDLGYKLKMQVNLKQ